MIASCTKSKYQSTVVRDKEFEPKKINSNPYIKAKKKAHDVIGQV